jgi:Predicted rRNA methylase (SpoU class)
MDYWYALDVNHHDNWREYSNSPKRAKRNWLLTTKASQTIFDVNFEPGDGLVFGSEDRGAPEFLHDELQNFRITIPHVNTEMRSLNLSTSAGITAYEMYRQITRK